MGRLPWEKVHRLTGFLTLELRAVYDYRYCHALQFLYIAIYSLSDPTKLPQALLVFPAGFRLEFYSGSLLAHALYLSSGLIPLYVLIVQPNLSKSFWVYIVTTAVNVFNSDHDDYGTAHHAGISVLTAILYLGDAVRFR